MSISSFDLKYVYPELWFTYEAERVKVKANPKMDIFCDISKLILTTYSHLIHIRTLDGVQLLM